MASVVFRTSSKIIAGKSELLVRFYAPNAVDLRAKSRIYVPHDDWNTQQQRLNIPRRNMNQHTIMLTQLQQQIDDLRAYILERFMADYYVNKSWLENVIAEFHHADAKNAPVLIADTVEQYIAAHDILDTTARKYRVVENLLRRFSSAKHCPLYVGQLTTAQIDDFVQFLRKESKQRKSGKDVIVERSQNTINTKLRCIRALCHWYVETGRAETNPFDRYKIPSDVYGTPTFLTLDERDKLYATHFDSVAMETQKDIFVFQCHVGCRVSDLMSLTTDNLTNDGFLQYIQQKLRKSKPIVVRVPLTDTAKEIIAKYAGQPDNRLLPFISDIKYNVAIKKVLRAAGITRTVIVQNKLTYEEEPRAICDIAASHLARRTFMGNMFKKVKSERIVSAFTGHAAHSQAFSRYTDVDDEMKRQIIQEIE